MIFSPVLISSLIVGPLRYFFSQAPKVQDGLYWDADEKVSTVEIGTVNDFNTIAVQKKPRILVNRGSYQITKSGLTDNMVESNGIKANLGKSDRTNMVWVDGVSQIIIEANNEGTCELLTDMVTHFIAGTRPIICNTLGFSDFGINMTVSSCEVDREDKEKFKVTINIPYRFEDHWRVQFDAIRFKTMYLTLVNEFNPSQQTPILNAGVLK